MLAAIHHRDAIAQQRFGQVAGDPQHGGAAVAMREELVGELLCRARVEAAREVVGDDQLRVARELAGDDDALLIAAREARHGQVRVGGLDAVALDQVDGGATQRGVVEPAVVLNGGRSSGAGRD